MKNMVRLCVIAGLASWAVQAVANEQNSVVDTLAENVFFQDAKIDLSTRNYWKYLKEDESQPKEVHAAWG